MKIQLLRTVCYGRCPAYSVTVRGDGSVHFSGEKYVQIQGEHGAHITPAAVMELLRQFEKAVFFVAGDNYIARVTDNPTYKLTLTVAGQTKTVTDYVGEQVGMLLVITDLENAVDDAAGTERWIKGDRVRHRRHSIRKIRPTAILMPRAEVLLPSLHSTAQSSRRTRSPAP